MNTVKDIIGYYQSIESFALVDGPGVRSVLFLQGCPYRCLYCHNPDTWPFLKSNPISAKEAFLKLYRYKTYWAKRGGITISGGEPLAQIDFLIQFAKIAKENGVHLTIDTSGANFTKENPFFDKFNELLKYTDLILLDLKVIDPLIHKKLTGFSNENVIKMFKYLSDIKFPIWIRHVLVPGLTLDRGLLEETSKFIKTLKNVDRVEVLPYHTLAIKKYQKLGIPYPLNSKTPSEKEVEFAKKILNVEGYTKYKQYC